MTEEPSEVERRDDRVSAPLLSICIPAYNGARYLPVVLHALLPQVSQTGGRVEVVLLDDASTDNTADLVAHSRQYGPVQYIRNQINQGSARNIVKGPTELATGEFVWVMS